MPLLRMVRHVPLQHRERLFRRAACRDRMRGCIGEPDMRLDHRGTGLLRVRLARSEDRNEHRAAWHIAGPKAQFREAETVDGTEPMHGFDEEECLTLLGESHQVRQHGKVRQRKAEALESGFIHAQREAVPVAYRQQLCAGHLHRKHLFQQCLLDPVLGKIMNADPLARWEVDRDPLGLGRHGCLCLGGIHTLPHANFSIQGAASKKQSAKERGTSEGSGSRGRV